MQSRVNSIWFLFGVQALIGIAEAIYSPAFDTLYSRHLTPKKAGREWGAWESMNYFSIAIGSAIGGLIASQLGFGFLFGVILGTIYTNIGATIGATLIFILTRYVFFMKAS